jgi:hypothetical protein
MTDSREAFNQQWNKFEFNNLEYAAPWQVIWTVIYDAIECLDNELHYVIFKTVKYNFYCLWIAKQKGESISLVDFFKMLNNATMNFKKNEFR